jgi:hypothetical protein
MVFVLISGRKQSGKDTSADFLVKAFNFNKVSFATELKKYTANLIKMLFNDHNGYAGFTEKSFESESIKRLRLESRFNSRGASPRLLLQKFGTDFVRENIDNDFWVKKTEDEILRLNKVKSQKLFVISDWRFKSELKYLKRAFKDSKFITIRVERNYIPVVIKIKYLFSRLFRLSHSSENNLDFFKTDYFIKNNKGVKELCVELNSVIVGQPQEAIMEEIKG